MTPEVEQVLAGTRTWAVAQGHALEFQRSLPDRCVQMVCTSSPYWGLRAYQTTPQVWGGDQACAHEWGPRRTRTKGGAGQNRGLNNAAEYRRERDVNAQVLRLGSFCLKCNAWLGELGQEPTPEMFADNLVAVFRESRRVLRDDGTLIINLVDTYWTGKGAPGGVDHRQPARRFGRRPQDCPPPDGIKPKDLVGIPWLVAFALRRDGWYLRQAFPWIKRNAMCESVNDRPGSSLEYFFLFSKGPKYFYDRYAVLKPDSGKPSGNDFDRPHRISQGGAGSKEQWEPGGGRNRRNSDWWLESLGAVVTEDGTFLGLDVPTKGIKDEHFACYPVELVEPLILAGTSEKGACVRCGGPWRRVVEKERKPTRPGVKSKVYEEPPLAEGSPYRKHHGDICGNRDPQRHVTVSRTVGWEPSCGCGETAVRPCVCLDFFLGSGSTIIAALKQGRAGIGSELNEEYATISRRRILNSLETVKDDTLPPTEKDRLALFGE